MNNRPFLVRRAPPLAGKIPAYRTTTTYWFSGYDKLDTFISSAGVSRGTDRYTARGTTEKLGYFGMSANPSEPIYRMNELT